jgi:hypothetical protein
MSGTDKSVRRAIRVADAGLPFLEFVENAPTDHTRARYVETLFNDLSYEELGLIKQARALFACGRKVLRDIIRAEHKFNAEITSIPIEALEVLEECGQEHVGTCYAKQIYLKDAECFTNSASLAETLPETYLYAEGVVQPPIGWPLHHAWNLLQKSNFAALDTTWPRADLHLYFGFSATQEVYRELFKASENRAGGFLHRKVWNQDIKRILLDTKT